MFAPSSPLVSDKFFDGLRHLERCNARDRYRPIGAGVADNVITAVAGNERHGGGAAPGASLFAT
jgi:hypothetical protein